MTDGLDQLSRRASNVLVLAPSHGGSWTAACEHLHVRHGKPATNLLVLTYVLGAASHLERFQEPRNRPAALAVVEATGDTSVTPPMETPFEVYVRHEAPSDLTGIGIQCSEFLTRWHDADGVSVCVESITSMLQYVPLQTAYRFLHVLTHRVSHASATAHYHMSPHAHTEKEIGTIKQLFDAVATYDPDTDTWDVVER